MPRGVIVAVTNACPPLALAHPAAAATAVVWYRRLPCVTTRAASHMVMAGIFSAGAGAGTIVRDGTDASPLLGRLLEELHDLFAAEVLSVLDPTDLALLARACWKCGEAALSSGVEIAGETWEGPLKLKHFLGSDELLTWGKDNGCPWNERTTALAARDGNLAALRWARELGCE